MSRRTTFNVATGEVTTVDIPAEEEAQRLALIAADPTPARLATREAIAAQASAALQADRDYLAIASPTTAQAAAQVRVLTQQNIKIIRLLLGLLDGAD